MAQQIPTPFFTRTPAWQKLGTYLAATRPQTVSDAIGLAGLNWRVALRPVFTDSGDQIPSHRAVVKDPGGEILGVVGTGYRPLQNERAFSFFDPFLASGACVLEAAGAAKGGRRIWVLARLTGAMADVTPGDTVHGYFLLSNAHDGSQAVRAQFTSIRVACWNTLTLAHRRAASGIEDCLRVRHTSGVEAGLTFVQETVDVAHRTFSATVSDYRRMAARKLPVGGLKRFVRDILEIPSGDGHVPKALDYIERSYSVGLGARLPGVYGSYWGAYNAVADWVDYVRGVKGEDTRLDSAWFGSGAKVKERAFALAVG